MEEFIANLKASSQGWLKPDQPMFVAQAPARLDVMGGIADYTGSLVLELPLGRRVAMAIQARTDQHVELHSLAWESPGQHAECRWPLARLYAPDGTLAAPEAFARTFDDDGAEWAKYLAGVFYFVLKQGLVPHFGGGATIVFDSTATPRAGIGSSAAVEVATLQAICALYGIRIDPLDGALLCQRCENLIVGAPCGIMDQVTSLMGRARSLLQLKCQPHEVLDPLPLPEGVTAVGVDSAVKHQVSGERYTQARVAAYMGHRIIVNRMQRAGADGDPTRGYLANVTPEQYVEQFRDHLPMKMRGADFLDRYGDTADPVTTVQPDTVYKVRSRTEHHIYENRRVHQFAQHLLRAARTRKREDLTEAGKLMYASHWSYGQRCGLGSIETDLLSNLIRERGPEQGFYGAKISGGGAGGTVAILMDDDERCFAALREIMQTYRQRTHRQPELFDGCSPGALQFGTKHVA